MSAPGSVRADRWTRLEQLVPPYPTALFDLLAEAVAPAVAPRVVDLGAGTGRASIPMAQRGWRVTALDVDPAALLGLRARARHAGCTVATVEGAAEGSSLSAARADLVTAAHAFHWFEAGPALAEMLRIVRPGGGCALFWDWRNPDRSALLAEHHELLRRFDIDPAIFLEARAAADSAAAILVGQPGIRDVARHDFDHESRMSAEDFRELCLMPRYIHDLASAEHAAFETALAEMIRRHADPATGTINVPYRTTAWIARRSTP